MKSDILDAVDRYAAFRSIVVPHQGIGQLKARIQLLMAETQNVLEQNAAQAASVPAGSFKPIELWYLPLVGPTCSTKSSTLRLVTRELAAPGIARGEQPILFVTLRSTVRTTKQLQFEILQAFDSDTDEKFLTGHYSEGHANLSLLDLARQRKTVLVVLDEANNMLKGDTGKVAAEMAKALKSMVNDAVFSLVLSGTQRVRELMQADAEFDGRKRYPMEFEPASIDDHRAVIEFCAYVQTLLQRMVSEGVIDRPFNPLATVDDMATVFEMAGGVNGAFSKQLSGALDNAFLDGRTFLTWDDLELAYMQWKRDRTLPGAKAKFRSPTKQTAETMRQIVGV